MQITKQRIISILKEIEVPYWTEGKNVSEDSVNIKCPFCSDDPSDHLGIFEGTGIFSCWRCKKKGPLSYLIHVLTGFPRERCEEMVEDGSNIFKEDSSSTINRIINEEITKENRKKKDFYGLPKEMELITEDTQFKLLHLYLERRKILLETTILHKCGICRTGSYMNRMIIPVFFNKSVVGFQAADLTGRADLKYKTSSNDINDYLYEYDNIKPSRRIIITEGILDAWRVGNDAVCTFGTHLTEKQKQLILDVHPKELILLWDNDAWIYANEEIGFFEPFIEKVNVVILPHGHDPDSYGREYGQAALLKFINESGV